MFALVLTAELNGYLFTFLTFLSLSRPRVTPVVANTDLPTRVTNLRPNDSTEDPFWYTFTVQCTSCRETHAKPVAVSRFVRYLFPPSFQIYHGLVSSVVNHPD